MCRVKDLSTRYPLDKDKAIGQLGGETKIFYSMLGKFESMTLLASFNEMRDAVNEKDFAKVKNKVYKRRSWLHRGGRHPLCVLTHAGTISVRTIRKMLSYYPTLIERFIAFRANRREGSLQ